MSFNNFVYEQGIIGLMMGTISAFAVSNFMEVIKTEVIVKLIKKISIIGNAILIASFIEFLITLSLLYIMYHFLLYPIFRDEIKKDKEEEEKYNKWKKNILQEIKNLDMGTVYI